MAFSPFCVLLNHQRPPGRSAAAGCRCKPCSGGQLLTANGRRKAQRAKGDAANIFREKGHGEVFQHDARPGGGQLKHRRAAQRPEKARVCGFIQENAHIIAILVIQKQ